MKEFIRLKRYYDAQKQGYACRIDWDQDDVLRQKGWIQFVVPSMYGLTAKGFEAYLGFIQETEALVRAENQKIME